MKNKATFIIFYYNTKIDFSLGEDGVGLTNTEILKMYFEVMFFFNIISVSSTIAKSIGKLR